MSHAEQRIDGDPVAGFRERFHESVRMRMVSDVPFGAFLSGGIDSSAVVASMSRYSNMPVRTFSVGFAESRYSELAYAREIAQAFGTQHHELVVSVSELMDYACTRQGTGCAGL
jgi:asparagine synthase (glutamine-hydrolysing)